MATRRLTDTFCRSAPPGRHTDAQTPGLALLVDAAGHRSWVWRGQRHGKRFELGLGRLDDRGLKDARDLAGDLRAALVAGGDPREVLRPPASVVSPRLATFAAKFIRGKYRAGHWRKGSRTARRWCRSVRDYCTTALLNRPVDEISAAEIVAVFEARWFSRSVSARRALTRLVLILDTAVALGQRPDNPARAALLILPRVKTQVTPRTCPPVEELPALYEGMCGTSGIIALAVRLTLLLAARPGEIRHLRLREVQGDTIVLAPDRTKSGRAFRYPLTAEAQGVISEAMKLRTGDNDLLFQSPVTGGRLGEISMVSSLQRVAPGVSLHGAARAGFRSWAQAEGVDWVVAEACLQHRVGGDPRLLTAYARDDLLAPRRGVLERWAQFLTGSAKIA